MIVLVLCIGLFLGQPAGTNPAVVQAPDSPVRLDRAKILNVVAGEPPVLLYSATNLTDDELEQFTVLVFIFDAQGQLKARQVAPGRRTLEARGTKYLNDGARRMDDRRDRSNRHRRESGPARELGDVVAGRSSERSRGGGQT